MLEQAGINLKTLNVDKLKSEYQELLLQKMSFLPSIKPVKKRFVS
jgi:hypothetical protein